MSAPIALAAWQERRLDQRSHNALAARLAREESWQAGRIKARDELDALITRRQLEIDNLRAQIREGVAV